ncbi:hypothetical protein ABB37_01331 [Leptomonas pyrrhocoris]|uniref:WW domain-containing protein n=1 Tax=Leptomonas pyrrhocoris TaxID=157538 RepID=A0A0M9G8K0_LEPPY|nr:hypothetical protein ABB37_01331 [Leptomonas pyrrhocoris]XP_015663307.1 hypothetical protein ABB37_01331 [Leptomonas pyrrhocoris]KPA84867.1 hypothetical protein ABB37_01331 [Leptomonas pyrrhocoris]KPA84868.1 hypothetical protein ABB37_01331 [Leptomonas pyrrhocoris]|eukprot:XP_015663306.1 hypothetical protein ABB37_01331 [Leptomonas pyrrhocoris]
MSTSASSYSSQWICRKDPRTQRTYYVNRRTGRSTWDPVPRTAMDTEAAAAVLYPAVVPVADPTSASVSLTLSNEARSSPTTPQVCTVNSKASLTRNSDSDTDRDASEGNRVKKAVVPPTGPSTRGSEADGNHTAERTNVAHASPVTSSSASDSTPAPQPPRQPAQPPSAHEPAKLTAAPVFFTAPSTSSLHIPYSPSASSAVFADMKGATTLGTTPVQLCHGFQKDAKHGADFLTACVASASVQPPPATVMRSPPNQTASSSSPFSPTLEIRRTAPTTDPSTPFLLNETQRPSGDNSSLSPVAGGSGPSQLLPPPPPPPLPSLVSHPVMSAARGAGNERVDGIGTTDFTAPAIEPSNKACASSSSSPPPPPPLQQQRQEEDVSGDEEAAAAEEWRLTRRVWELEGERARLESELAVLRGPVEVEAQSIAEDHARLLEAQRALETAATLAVNQQKTKREELDGLQQRLTELQEQRENAKFLISTMQERLSLVKERCHRVQDEGERLNRERRELEEVLLPTEEAASRDVQNRLYEQRQRVAAQRQQLDDLERAITRGRSDVQRRKHRLDELTAIAVDEGHISKNGEHSLASLAARKKSQTWKEESLSRKGTNDALVVTVAETAASPSEHGEQLHARIAELQREVSSLQFASGALYENTLLTAQQQVLREWTQRLRGEAEPWQRPLEEARAMLQKLNRFYEAQACKYGTRTQDS